MNIFNILTSRINNFLFIYFHFGYPIVNFLYWQINTYLLTYLNQRENHGTTKESCGLPTPTPKNIPSEFSVFKKIDTIKLIIIQNEKNLHMLHIFD